MTSVELGGTTFPGRVWTASGCGGTGRELAAYVDLARLGAFVTRTITLEPRHDEGGRVREVFGGLLRPVGLPNPGLDGFLATELPWLAQQQVPVVVSIAAEGPGEYAELARRVGTGPGVRAVEVNLADPGQLDDPQLAGRLANTYQLAKVLGTVRAAVPRGMPVLAKLGVREDVPALARAVRDAGADAVVLANAVPGVGVPGPVGGGGPVALSGPALRPLALCAVARVRAEVPDLPLIGAGGVTCGADARAFLAAGAVAVQVGTACLVDPAAPVRVAEELEGQALDPPAPALPAPDPEGTT